jgi:hypothetical protein
MRMVSFADPNTIVPLEHWEFRGETWVGEAFGFSEWLRPRSRPDELHAMSLDLTDCPFGVQALRKLGLSLWLGASLQEVIAQLGQPDSVEQFIPGRHTFSFRRLCAPFEVSCTISEKGGLLYVSVFLPVNAS